MGMIAILWPNPAISKSESQFMWLIHNDNHISVVYDKTTHCQYLVYDGFRSGGITPRLDANGDPVCKKLIFKG